MINFAGWHSEEVPHYELQFVIKKINTFAAYKTTIYMTQHSSQAQFRKELLLCIEHLNVLYLKYIFWMHLLSFYQSYFFACKSFGS